MLAEEQCYIHRIHTPITSFIAIAGVKDQVERFRVLNMSMNRQQLIYSYNRIVYLILVVSDYKFTNSGEGLVNETAVN